MFKCFYLRDGKLGCKNHTNHIKILVKFLRVNEEFVSEQFFDYLTFGVRCMDFAQHWENEFQEIPWIYYSMENLLSARDLVYRFYREMKYEITDDLKHSLIDAIECVEWFGVNLKDNPRNRRFKDFHEYDKVVLKRNSDYIRHLHCKFIQDANREAKRLIRKAEENRKNSHPSDALLKPVYSEEKPKVKHYNDFGEYLDDHPEIVKMAEKYPTMFQERVYEYHTPLKEKLKLIALYTVVIVSSWFVGSVLGSLIKGIF